MKKTLAELHMSHGVIQVIERGQRFYWKVKGAGREFGPFATLLDAISGLEASHGTDCGWDASCEDSDVGITAWMDPETGLPPEAAILHVEES